MSNILKVEARTMVVPLDKPMKISTRAVGERHYTLVRVVAEDGNVGHGFCYAGNSGGIVGSTVVRTLLAPIVESSDSLRVEGLWQEMYQAALLQGRAGIVSRAISAVDIALWDLNAKSADLPLYKYLGYARSDAVPAYASGGYYFEGKTPADLAEEVGGYVSDGFTAVKIKVGGVALDEDTERIRLARDAIGEDVRLMLDANNAWNDWTTAYRSLRAWEAYDPFWIEEPFSPDDLANHSRLAKTGIASVATGELEYGRWRHAEILRSEAAAFLQTDAAVCGGISEFRKIVDLASSCGVGVYPHWFHDLHAHLVASMPNAAMVEYFPDSSVLNFRDLIDEQLEFHDGELQLSSRAGLGFAFDSGALERFGVDKWS